MSENTVVKFVETHLIRTRMSQRMCSLLRISLNRPLRVAVQQSNYRSLFGYLRIAFNSVDRSRLKEIGPDRLCAEW